MPSPTKGARLGGSPAHERLMLANLATSLFEHGRITTTAAKARKLRPFAERLITKAKRGDLHNRREIMRVIRDKDIVHKLVAEIGPFFAERNGGYERRSPALYGAVSDEAHRHGARVTAHVFTLEDGSEISVKGDEEIEYDGEKHTAANLYDALKEGYYGKF